MRSVRPLQEVSSDLALLIDTILQYEPWDRLLVGKALHVYRAWAEYAIHEEVKIETLFPYEPFLSDRY